jgi:DNA gyrase/topoisomerase IV subunit A
VIGVLSVNDRDDLVCITSQGNTLKLRLAEVATLGKTAMGVRIVNITKPDVVVGVARVVKEEQAEVGSGLEEAGPETGVDDEADAPEAQGEDTTES